jgi:hypothetical protein
MKTEHEQQAMITALKKGEVKEVPYIDYVIKEMETLEAIQRKARISKAKHYKESLEAAEEDVAKLSQQAAYWAYQAFGDRDAITRRNEVFENYEFTVLVSRKPKQD